MNKMNLLNSTKERFSFRELEHIAVNYAIHCLKGYDGTFRDYYSDIRNDWRKCLKQKDKENYETKKI